MNKITNDLYYVGVNDHKVDLFEGQYIVPNGMAYNSYVIMDDKIAVMDTVDKNFTHEWLDNIANVLKDKTPDYLVVQHMEPDHSANIMNFVKTYPNVCVVGNAKTFKMIEQFFDVEIENKLVVTPSLQPLYLFWSIWFIVDHHIGVKPKISERVDPVQILFHRTVEVR